jgi:hypothetical protein
MSRGRSLCFGRAVLWVCCVSAAVKGAEAGPAGRLGTLEGAAAPQIVAKDTTAESKQGLGTSRHYLQVSFFFLFSLRVDTTSVQLLGRTY